MKIKLSFIELQDYVNRRFDRCIELSGITGKDLRIGVSQKMLLMTMTLNIEVHIDIVSAESVTLTYNGCFGTDMIVRSLINCYISKFPDLKSAVEIGRDRRVTVFFSKIEKAKALFDRLCLRDIEIEEDCLIIDAQMK